MRRGPVRRLLEVRGLVGGLTRPHRTVRLTSEDGVGLVASFLPGPDPGAPAVVLAHGFAAHRRKPAYALLADVLSHRAHVLTVDLRGHGASGGRSTLGDREALDVAAAVDWLRGRDHEAIVAVGVSMGGSAVAHALARGSPVTAGVLVSTPALLGRTDTAPMAYLDRVWRSGWRRRGLEVLASIRITPPGGWRGFDHPRDLAARVSVPLLVVHGQDDHFFPVEDAEVLAAAAAGPATVWREPAGFGHAEDGLTATFAERLGQAVDAVIATGTFPSLEELTAAPAAVEDAGDRAGTSDRAGRGW